MRKVFALLVLSIVCGACGGIVTRETGTAREEEESRRYLRVVLLSEPSEDAPGIPTHAGDLCENHPDYAGPERHGHRFEIIASSPHPMRFMIFGDSESGLGEPRQMRFGYMPGGHGVLCILTLDSSRRRESTAPGGVAIIYGHDPMYSAPDFAGVTYSMYLDGILLRIDGVDTPVQRGHPFGIAMFRPAPWSNEIIRY